MRTFAYCRVSTNDQTVENQIVAIKNAGYEVTKTRVFSDEGVSGTKPAMQRPEFVRLIDRLEEGDALVVLKLDRLGRDNRDVQNTVETLLGRGIKLVCLDLPVKDLSSSEGKMMLQMFAAFAEFERNRISERTKDGLQRVKESGVKLGRPPATETRDKVQALKQSGFSQSRVAASLKISMRTVSRHW